MASLTENVAKVVAAHSALKTAIAAKGATVPEDAKLSDLPALVESIPEASAPAWDRPADWPRIDLIPVRGLSYDVIYMVVAKPAAGHGLCMAAKVDSAEASTWFMERVTVSDDGLTVTAVEGSRVTSAAGTVGSTSTTVDLAFPANDPVGTLYAVRVGVTDPTKKFRSGFCPEWASPAGLNDPFYSDSRRSGRGYNSGVVQEMIIRIPGRTVGRIGGSVMFNGPRHVALYNMSGMNDVGFRLVLGLEYVEFREGGHFTITGPWTPGLNVENVYDTHITRPVADWDDDFELRVDTNSPGGYATLFLQRHDGTVYPFDRIKDKAGAAAPDWSSFHTLDSAFCKFDRVRSISLPPGYGSTAASLTRTFFGCNSLESLVLPEGFGSGATGLTSTFANCTSLKTLSLPSSFVPTSTTARQATFYYCASLTSLELPAGFVSDGSLYQMLRGCASLASVDFGATASGVPFSVTAVFDGCSSLRNVTGAFRAKTALDLSGAPLLTHDSLVHIIDCLSTVTTTVALSLGPANMPKLTDEEIAVATAKGWTVS